MRTDDKQWMIFLFLCGFTINVTAQGIDNQSAQGYGQQEGYVTGAEMAPPPPGPYQVDPGAKSANINYDMHETAPLQQQSQPYGGYAMPQYPPAQMSGNPYRQGYYPPPAPAPGGYYRQYGGAYGNGYPPPQYPQPQYIAPYGPRY